MQFHLAVSLPEGDVWTALQFVTLLLSTKEVILTIYYAFNNELLCSSGGKIKYWFSANYETLNFVFNTNITFQMFLRQ